MKGDKRRSRVCDEKRWVEFEDKCGKSNLGYHTGHTSWAIAELADIKLYLHTGDFFTLQIIVIYSLFFQF